VDRGGLAAAARETDSPEGGHHARATGVKFAGEGIPCAVPNERGSPRVITTYQVVEW